MYMRGNADRIWSHKWQFRTAWKSKEAVKVQRYFISPGVHGVDGFDISRIGTISHEYVWQDKGGC
jgi:hypothetical protein